MMDVLLDVVSMIINALIVLLLAPLLEGIVRKVVARIQGRRGPPVTQPYRDLAKLFTRIYQTRPDVSCPQLYDLAPVAVFACVITTAALVPTIVSRPLTLADIIVVFYLMALARFIMSIASFNTSNPFAVVGMAREHILTLGVEPVALTAAVIAALIASSNSIAGIAMDIPAGLLAGHWAYIPALAAFISAILADLALPPFDVAEAEQEISEALLSEYGGPHLALLKLAIACKRLTMVNLLFALFLPYGIAYDFSFSALLTSVPLYILKVLVTALLLAVLVAGSARMRVHDVFNYLFYAFSLSIVAGITYIVMG